MKLYIFSQKKQESASCICVNACYLYVSQSVSTNYFNAELGDITTNAAASISYVSSCPSTLTTGGHKTCEIFYWEWFEIIVVEHCKLRPVI